MAFLQGALAGYGIAIPVGAIAVLIIDTALRGGFALGFMAGAGAASADVLYAILAAVAGAALTSILLPFAGPIRILSGIVLVAIGSYGLYSLALRRRHEKVQANAFAMAGDAATIATVTKPVTGGWRTYRQFLALTVLNPLTVAYFGSLILGGSGSSLSQPVDRVLFVLGAGLASLSWQTALAAFGALARRSLPLRWQFILILFGNLLVIGFGIGMLAG